MVLGQFYKKNICFLSPLLTWAAVILCACSNSELPVASAFIDIDYDSTFVDMLRVSSAGKYVFLGTNDANAKADERPQMRVNFDYDFSIGQHEVTCGEFNDLMVAETGLSLNCESDSHPAANVTYYDAALFANARSKSAGLDSAYTYTEARFDDSHHCIGLEGFVFSPASKGFRLPTEAEWVLVARFIWDTDKGWFASNSGYKPHKVCSAKTSADEFCDFAGNVMEWVNDWSGNFRDTVLLDYVGAPDGGGLGKRIVKGGSFRNDDYSVKLHSRGDVYTVTSATRAGYVGFRLAIGNIPNASWMGNDGLATESRVVTISNSVDLRKFTGTYRSILAFRDDVTGNIAFVDYATGSLTVVEIADSIDAYHPDISPDGKHVAFCTGLEGVSGKSSVYVRDLNVAGTNLVRLNVDNAAIPRWRVLPNGDTVIVYVSDAGNNKDESTFLRSSTWQVPYSKGKFGTPSKLFDGAYHGGVNSSNDFAVSGARLLRVRTGEKDSVWYNGEQACNASLSKDSSNRTLFLDFGGNTGREFAGVNYGTHEMLLIADSTGLLEQAVPAPIGMSFDHTEWVGKNLVIATLTNVDGAHSKIVLLNTADSAMIVLAEGDELWHPSMWVKTNVVPVGGPLNYDSAGAYFTPHGSESAIILRYKMELLWKYRDSANVVFMGSSRSFGGLLPEVLKSPFFAVNLSYAPSSIYAYVPFFENYVLNHMKKTKYLAIGLDIDFWWKNYMEDNFFYSEYLLYPGYVYDENHAYWKDSYPEGLYELTSNSLGMIEYESKLLSKRGFQDAGCSDWGGDVVVAYDSTWFEKNPQWFYNSLNQLKIIVDLAQQSGIYVVGIIFPQSPHYRQSGAFGRYGLQRSAARKLISEINDLSKTYSNFILMDENKMGDHDYKENMAQNWDHLCLEGAKQLTSRLESLLQKLK